MSVLIESSGGSSDFARIAKLLTPELTFWERTPSTGHIRIIGRAQTPRTFKGVTHSLDFGSVTVTVRINGSPIPGLTLLVPGTTPFNARATGGNILPVNGILEIVLIRATNPKGLYLQFDYDWIL
jgi:hypothetical protein